jgi:chemotaxis protein methyltransferase CheR
VSHSTESPALQQLVALIRETTGNIVPPARFSFLEEVAHRRSQARGCGAVSEYVKALASGDLDREWESLIPLITIKESYFFRAPQQFEAIRQHALPALLRARASTRRLRIWSAACARGEEPATLAIVLSEELALTGWDWSIVATDVDEDALAGARLGLYGERAVAGVPPVLLERYFRRRGKLFEVDAELRSRIDYRSLNLAHPPFPLPFQDFDLILLRNVLIYFRRPLQRWVMSEVGRILEPHGYLFLGASETLWQIQEELEAIDLGACFCYRHRPKNATPPAASSSTPAPATTPPSRPARVQPAAPSPEPEPEKTSSAWLDLQDPRAWSVLRSTSVTPGLPPDAGPKVDDTALHSLDSRGSSASEPCAVHARLAEAARELAANRVDQAAKILADVLSAEPSEPAAHALEGFLHDLAGRTEEAAFSYRAALYLDPALFQVRVLLADCLLRLGQKDRAEHQFREVLALLDGGRDRELALYADLPLPSRERAQRRCRQVLLGR